MDAPRPDGDTPFDVVFYDGTCGMCHRGVQFCLKRDTRGALRYAPLQGTTFAETIPESERAALPDSIILRTADGRTLVYSDATAHTLRRLGGVWSLLGALLALVPRVVRDPAYRFIARRRKRFFGEAKTLCPLLPPEQQARFLP